MANTLIGVFKTFEEAKIAVDRLAQDGVACRDIRVHSLDVDIGSWDGAIEGDAARIPAYHPLDEPKIQPEGGAAQFLELFLGGEDPAPRESHLREAVQRGNALLAVDIRDESRLNAIWAALNGAGALEVVER